MACRSYISFICQVTILFIDLNHTTTLRHDSKIGCSRNDLVKSINQTRNWTYKFSKKIEKHAKRCRHKLHSAHPMVNWHESILMRCDWQYFTCGREKGIFWYFQFFLMFVTSYCVIFEKPTRILILDLECNQPCRPTRLCLAFVMNDYNLAITDDIWIVSLTALGALEVVIYCILKVQVAQDLPKGPQNLFAPCTSTWNTTARLRNISCINSLVQAT